MERARALIAVTAPGAVVRWEQLRLPFEVGGPHGGFRVPRQVYTRDASNDYEAVQAERGPGAMCISPRSSTG